jgi:hypothetical protein
MALVANHYYFSQKDLWRNKKVSSLEGETELLVCELDGNSTAVPTMPQFDS